MALTPGVRFGVYEITALLGEGGMGQVYRATDTKLKRPVAIKILPAAVAADSDRLARFHREAEVLASLNHPHIAGIYGLEEGGGITALVMELVEGDDLSQRIAQGAIPLDEALPIAKQIAEALEAAHEQGIIHRDLKPANIKVRSDGTVKVLDFGLAKATEAVAGSSPNLSMSPTITTPAMTQAGMILGTAAYMAPEQARGKAVDRRADIWAFGVVLFEMLTATRAFGEEDVSMTLSKILQREPDFDVLPPTAPARVRQLLRLCLRKDPKQRIGDMGDVRLALEGAFETSAPHSTAVAATAAPRGRLAWTIAAVAGLAAVTLAVPAVRYLREAPLAHPVLQVSVAGPEGNSFSRWAEVSPDGRFIAYGTDDGRLWLKPMAAPEARLLVQEPVGRAVTPPSTYAFWSRDSRWLAYFSDGRLKKIDTTSPTPSPLVVCECAQNPRGGTWQGDVIAFAPGANGVIMRVPASGGTPTPVTTIDGRLDASHRFPSFLPDGHHFLYVVSSSDPGRSGIHVGDIDGGPAPDTRLIDADSHATFVPSTPGSTRGHLLFVKDDSLRAVPFDAYRIELLGEPAVLAPNVSPQNARGGFSASDGGLLAYYGGRLFPTATLVWYARDGSPQGAVVPGDHGSFSGVGAGLRLSPDGRMVAAAYTRTAGAANRTSLIDVARGTAAPLLAPTSFAIMPVWARDSKTLLLSYSAAGMPGMVRYSTERGGPPELLLASAAAALPTDWSADGRLILFHSVSAETAGDIYALTLPEKKSYPWVKGAASEYQGQLVPGATGPWWMAYVSNESGQPEVYLERFTLEGQRSGRARVSVDGGESPRWRADGRELYYMSGPRLMAVGIGTDFAVGVPRELFAVQTALRGSIYLPHEYDVSADGQRFVFATVTSEPKPVPLSVVINWQQVLAH